MAQAKVKTKTDARAYLAISFIGGGSSWVEGEDQDKMIAALHKQVRKDWEHLFDIKENPGVRIYALDGAEHWWADHEGVFDHDTNRKLKLIRYVGLVHDGIGKPPKHVDKIYG
jgi:hypothetical protein